MTTKSSGWSERGTNKPKGTQELRSRHTSSIPLLISSVGLNSVIFQESGSFSATTFEPSIRTIPIRAALSQSCSLPTSKTGGLDHWHRCVSRTSSTASHKMAEELDVFRRKLPSVDRRYDHLTNAEWWNGEVRAGNDGRGKG